LEVSGDVNYTGAGKQGQLRVSGSTNNNYELMLGYDTTDDFGFITTAKYNTGWRNLALNPDGGNVGIGTTSPGYKLDINGTAGIASTNGLYFATQLAYPPYIKGDWVDNNSTGLEFHSFVATVDTTAIDISNTSGSVTIGVDLYTHDGGVHSSSDINLKDVTGNYTRGLAEILNLNPIDFHYKVDNELGLDSTKQSVGLSAQEVQVLIPEAVAVGDKGYLTLTQGPIFYAIINAIKELNAEKDAEINELKQRISALENPK